MWKKYDNLYSVSEQGEVRNDKTMHILIGDINSKGYRRVVLKGKKKHFVHRLVATLFVDNPDDLPQVNHKDHNKLNNHKDNLEWCDNDYNNKHSFMNGKLSGNRKISMTQLTEIIQHLKNRTKSIKELALLYNVSESTISSIKQGKNSKRLNY